MTGRRFVLVVGALAMACGSPAERVAPPAPSVDRAAVLAKADAADGTSDHVVSNCAVCALDMEGSSDHTASLSGYTLHFCSAECRETFQHNPDAVLARLASARR